MRIEMMLWAGVAVFFAVIGALYWLVDGDPAGASLLLMATAPRRAVRRVDLGLAPPPRATRDRRTASTPTPRDETGIVGVYPDGQPAPARPRRRHHAPAALGVVLGSWMTIAGVAIVASQVALLARDADR